MEYPQLTSGHNLNFEILIVIMLFRISNIYSTGEFVFTQIQKCQSITQQFYFIYNKNIIFSGDLFRTLMGHLQTLWETDQELSIFQNIAGSQTRLVSRNALKYIYIGLRSVSHRTWRWPNKGRNMSPWQYTIFTVYEIKFIAWHVVFMC